MPTAPTLSAPAIATSAAAREDRARAWSGLAVARIRRGVADAAAHASKALTDTLRRAPEGRATARKARNSPSTRAALHRLNELWIDLAGPSVDSTEGLVRDAWRDALESAFERWAAILPAETLRSDPTPIGAELRAMRRITIHGLELRQEIGAPLERAARQLLAAIGTAGSRATPARDGADAIRAWAVRTIDNLYLAADTAIHHGFAVADTAAAWHLTKPELREGEPPLAV